MAEPTKAELAEQLASMTRRASDAESRVATLTTDLATANERADQEAKARQEAEKAHDATKEELRATAASLKAYKGSATRAKAAATVLQKQLSPEARPIGAMRPARSEAEQAARDEALALAFAGDTTELVFSDGKREIRELAPLTVTGDAWRDTPQGKVLGHEPLLDPGDCNRETIELRGFALLNEAGEQVAYQALPDPVLLRRNQRTRLAANTVRF